MNLLPFGSGERQSTTRWDIEVRLNYIVSGMAALDAAMKAEQGSEFNAQPVEASSINSSMTTEFKDDRRIYAEHLQQAAPNLIDAAARSEADHLEHVHRLAQQARNEAL